MIGIEIVLLIAAIGLVAGLNLGPNRWIGFVTVCFGCLAGAGLLGLGPQFTEYLIFMPQILLFVVIVSLFSFGFYQLLILSILISGSVWALLYKHVFVTNIYEELAYFLALVLVFSGLPIFVFSVQKDSYEKVEKLVALQQLWLRLSFLVWARSNALNLGHYELFEDLLTGLTIYGALVLGVRVVLGRGLGWILGTQTFFTIFMMAAILGVSAKDQFLIFLWILTAGAGHLIPNVAGKSRVIEDFLRHADYGCIGSSLFFGGLYLVSRIHGDSISLLSWTTLLFCVGLFSYLRPITNTDSPRSPALVRSVLLSRLFLHIVLVTCVLIWPYIADGRS